MNKEGILSSSYSTIKLHNPTTESSSTSSYLVGDVKWILVSGAQFRALCKSNSIPLWITIADTKWFRECCMIPMESAS